MVAHQHVRKGRERRIVQSAAKLRFFFVEGGVVLLRRVLDGVVLGVVRFDEDFAR